MFWYLPDWIDIGDKTFKYRCTGLTSLWCHIFALHLLKGIILDLLLKMPTVSCFMILSKYAFLQLHFFTWHLMNMYLIVPESLMNRFCSVYCLVKHKHFFSWLSYCFNLIHFSLLLVNYLLHRFHSAFYRNWLKSYCMLTLSQSFQIRQPILNHSSKNPSALISWLFSFPLIVFSLIMLQN